MSLFNLDGVELDLPVGFKVGLVDNVWCVVSKSVKSKSNKKPEFISDSITNEENAPRGKVIKQVREKFPKVGSEEIVYAHYRSTIYSTFAAVGYGCHIIEKVEGQDLAWKVKRVIKQSRKK